MGEAILSKMFKEWSRARFCFPCNNSHTLYFLVKIQLLKLRDLASECLNYNSFGTFGIFGTTK